MNDTISNLIKSILLALVEHKDKVKVHDPVEARESVLFEIEVAESDIGKVVGKEGRHLAAIRMLVNAVALSDKKGKRATVQLLGTLDRKSYESAWRDQPTRFKK